MLCNCRILPAVSMVASRLLFAVAALVILYCLLQLDFVNRIGVAA